MPRITGAAVPLKTSQRADGVIVGHGIVAGIVHVVRPLVDVLRPRLDDLDPTSAAYLNLLPLDPRPLTSTARDECHAARYQDPQNLLFPRTFKFVGDQEIHRVVDIGQRISCRQVHRHRAVELSVAYGFPCLVQLLRRACQAVNPIGVARVQRCGQLAVATIEVDHKSTTNTAG